MISIYTLLSEDVKSSAKRGIDAKASIELIANSRRKQGTEYGVHPSIIS